ncbi:MAG: hypothetical protein AAF206_19460 [Bacteroidota bacterium]
MIWIHRCILLLAIYLELLLISDLRLDAVAQGPNWQAGTLFLLALFIGMYPLFWINKPLTPNWTWKTRIEHAAVWPIIRRILSHPFSLFAISWITLWKNVPIIQAGIERYEINVANSDIIPQIQVLLERFLAGENPYQPITDWGYKLISPYLPMYWLPFGIPECFDFDPRWLCFSIFVLGAFALIYQLSQQSMALPLKILLALAPGEYLWHYINAYPIVSSHTVELMIAGYYLLLTAALLSQNSWLRTIALICCLLSRFSLLLWMPLYVLIRWDQLTRRGFLKEMGGLLAAVSLLYLIPFFLRDPGFFFEGLAYHDKVALRNWTFEPWFDATGRPGILFKGVGLAGYVYEWFGGEVAQKLALIKKAQLVLSLLVSIGLGILWRIRLKGNRIFALISLKIGLVVFYNLLAMPVEYYWLVPSILSLGLLIWAFSDRQPESEDRQHTQQH